MFPGSRVPRPGPLPVLNDPVAESPPPIHVVAGVLSDARGRILLARREGARELAGLWEFPGGKVEPGETPRQALARELREEIGIELDEDAPAPLISVPHRMANGKRILLDAYRIARFRGRARGMESQAVTWVPPERLGNYSMPGADAPVVAALRQPASYLITPEPGADADAFLHRLARALEGGVRRVQLRARHLDADALAERARAAAALAVRYGAELLLNSGSLGLEATLRLAGSLGIGLHLTAADLARIDARPLPGGTPLGASCHDLDELRKAQRADVDFAVLGPVNPTASHPHAQALGFSRFARLRERVVLPIYALGGLTVADHDRARAHGAQGVAAIRGLWPAD